MKRRVFKVSAFFVMIAVLMLAGCTNEPAYMGPSPYESVVVVGIDGGGELFHDGDCVLPEFAAFFATDGVLGYNFRCETPSISAQNWGAYLHGVTPDKLEVANIKIAVQRFTNRKYPSVFQAIRNADPTCVLASFCTWAPINYGLIETSAKVHKVPDKKFMNELYLDGRNLELVLDYLDNLDGAKPKMLFVQFVDADETGHMYGFGSPEYIEEVKRSQSYALEVFSRFDPEKTLFIVIPDHGGKMDGTHGGDTDEEMSIFFGIRGKTVNPAALTSFRPIDLAPMILNALNITIPSSMEGDPHESLFNE